MNKIFNLQRGFALPSVLALSLTAIIVITALLAAVSMEYRGSYADHYQRLAEEAAEAGVGYATSCLSLNNHRQTWGSESEVSGKPPLTPQADCNGDTSKYPSNQFVYSNSNVRTRFVVPDLDFAATYSVQISATGYAEVLDSHGAVIRTYTSIQKKVITWPADLHGTNSVSGVFRTCAVLSGQVYCWGYNSYGQLGNGRYDLSTGSFERPANDKTVDSAVPVKVLQEEGGLLGKRVVKLATGAFHTCALTEGGQVYCWGGNNRSQLAIEGAYFSARPVLIGGALSGKVVTEIGAAGYTTCAIADGKIYCWGENNYGQAGTNSTVRPTTPTLVATGGTSNTLPANYTATALSTSGGRSAVMCAIANDRAYCWGNNDIGQLGIGATGGVRRLPTRVGGVLYNQTVTTITLDGNERADLGSVTHVCAVAGGKAYCWGENNFGQIGDGTTTRRSLPVAVNTSGILAGKTIVDVKAGLRHTCALSSAGAAYCWGRSTEGQVGNGTFNTAVLSPSQVVQEPGKLDGTNIIALSAGVNRGCAVVTNGRTFCWGLNNAGQIGDGTLNNRNVPTESLFLRPIENQYIY